MSDSNLLLNKKVYKFNIIYYMTKILEVLFNIVSIIMMVDVLGFMFWVMSGQFPVDSFHIGMITKIILQAIFF